MQQGYFITGTDTGVGKTWCSVALMHYFKKQGKSVAGMKPVASGASWINDQLINDDALLLQQNASKNFRYDIVNPYAFEMPVAPHIAAEKTGESIDLERIVENIAEIQNSCEIVIVEGVGGWLVPLGPKLGIADMAKRLGFPVIVVVAIRLGCINHARLTFSALHAAGVLCAGWIANCTEPGMLAKEENIQTIARFSGAPLLGSLPFSPKPNFSALASHLKI
jgi:dethiobiotin synthetase